MTKTAAHNVFGVSSGGLIALQAALDPPSIHKAVINEPPLDIDSSIMTMVQAFMPRFDRDIAEGKVAEATVTFLKDSGALFLPGIITVWLAVGVGDIGLSLAVILNALQIGSRHK